MEEKIYFQPGDIVILRQDIENKPKMIVVKKETAIFKNKVNEDNILKGIRCRWFNNNKDLCEGIFNTKDLIKLENND